MTRNPSVPELPWLAGWCAYKRGDLSTAIAWSKLAIETACQNKLDTGAIFRHLPAWYEAPYDILRFAYRQLEMPELA